MRKHLLAGALVLFAALLARTQLVDAATKPYTTPFSGLVTDFTENTDEQWSLVGGEYENVVSASAGPFSAVGVISSAGLSFSNVVGSDFVMSTKFNLDTVTTTGSVDSTIAVGFGVAFVERQLLRLRRQPLPCNVRGRRLDHSSHGAAPTQ